MAQTIYETLGLSRSEFLSNVDKLALCEPLTNYRSSASLFMGMNTENFPPSVRERAEQIAITKGQYVSKFFTWLDKEGELEVYQYNEVDLFPVFVD